jgi:hypothetical protein
MKMTRYITIAFLIFSTCSIKAQNEELTPGALGIFYTPEMQMCGDSNSRFSTLQYYNINGKNAKSSQQILAEWRSFFKKPTDFKESGFLTIRFIVNCNGEPRVHRFYEMDLNYQKKTFPDALKTQVWAFVQQLGGFKKGVFTYEDKKYDVNYYYYFIFKIQDGEFKTIAP